MEDPSDQTALVRMLGSLLDTNEEEIGERDLRRIVAVRLRWIIDHQFGRLAELLYRFDLDEERVKLAFATTPPDAVHEVLADLVLERARQKIVSRAQRRRGLS